MKAWIVKDNLGILLCYDYPELIESNIKGNIWTSNDYREIKARVLPKDLREKLNNHDIFEIDIVLKKIHKCTQSL